MKIYKKILSEFFDQIATGAKKYEVRLGDFECNSGDVLVLQELDTKTKQLTGREIEKTVADVKKIDINNTHWPKAEIEKYGLQIISLEQ